MLGRADYRFGTNDRKLPAHGHFLASDASSLRYWLWYSHGRRLYSVYNHRTPFDINGGRSVILTGHFI